MVKTISAVFRGGVFVPLAPINDIATETKLSIDVYLPHSSSVDTDLLNGDSYTFEENLQLLYDTAGMLGPLKAEDVRYIIESPELAQENLYLEEEQL